MKKTYTLIAFAAIALTFTSLQTVSAMNSDSHDSGHHADINSGRDFGGHVKDMNDHFSGDHNPGKHHKGYSGLKD